MTVTASGQKLADRIKKAIEDHVITWGEYEEIISISHEDGMIDQHEKVLLRELKNLIANKVVRRVAR